MKKRKNLKGAVVLLIAVAMFLSTVTVTADTNNPTATSNENPQPINEQTNSIPIEKMGLDPIIWDNGGTVSGGNLYSSQEDIVYPFISQVADDFHFEQDMWVTDFHFWGGFWGGTAFDPCDFEVHIYADDGSGTAPTGGGMPDPRPTALWSGSYAGVTGLPLDPNGFYEYEVIIDPPFNAEACHKYWIVVMAVFPFPPQWGWANTGQITLSPAVQGFPFLGTPFWTVITPEVDMAFYLTGIPKEEPCEPSIDVEKEVWDEKNGRWVDADTENEAFDIPICHNATFRITIHNNGDCPLWDIHVFDTMHDSLEFISANPVPDNFSYVPPNYFMYWYFPGPLLPCETITITIVAHVVGPEPCQIDPNLVEVDAVCEHGKTVSDSDMCWVHAIKGSKAIERPFLRFLQSYPNLFRIIEKLLQRLGL
jgi:hypothetical protein